MSEASPWKTLSSRVVYQNPWMTVREDQVIRPDGKPGIYGVIDKGAATGVVAIDDEGRVVLVGQYRYPMGRYSWEIVEGGAESGEEPLQAAQRELREEAGLVAADWEPLGGVLQVSNCVTSEEGFLFLARGLSEVPAEPEGTEVLQIARVPLAQALARVDSGEIEDAMSVVALLRAARRPDLQPYFASRTL
jgi:8-oxo-dGTP pyrophosphatase MutT (NUDIX family)